MAEFPNNLFDVSDQTVIITGGLGQLGREFSSALLARGAKVAIFDRAEPKGTASQWLVEHSTRDALLVSVVDVTRRDSVENGLAQVNARWGTPHALINAAAIDAPPDASTEENGPFENYPESSWQEVIDVNLNGVFLCCQVIGAQLAAAGRGSIINISSIYGLVSPDQRIYDYRGRRGGRPFFKPIAYSASKSALLNVTRYLSTYWAGRNVRVNTLTLGGVYNNQDQEFLRGYTDRVPLRRMARKDEYNGAIIFLLSAASSYMSGANLVIDGGWTAW